MRPLPDGPVGMLFHAWPPRLNLSFLRDAVVNVALYVPLGMSAHFAFRKWPPKFFDLYGPVLLGLVLSTSIELAQVFEPVRDASVVDIATNVMGSMLGVVLAVVFETIGGPAATGAVHRRWNRRLADRAALALLFTGALLSGLGSWRNVIMAIAAASLVVLIAWLAVSEDFPLGGKDAKKAAQPETYTLGDGVKDLFNYMLPFCYSGILFAYIAIFALFPLIPSFAVPGKNLSALMITAGMFGTVAGIIAAKTYPLRIPLIRYSGLIMTLFIALMILTTNQMVAYGAAFLAGFFMFLPMTAMVTLPQELPGMTPGRVTVVFGMFWSISYIIETIWMFAASQLADKTGDPFKAAIFVLICSISAFVASFFLPETGHKPAKPVAAHAAA